MFHRLSFFAAANIFIGVATSLAIATAEAQQGAQAKWPQRPVKIIVPYAAGSATDLIPRTIFDAVGAKVGHTKITKRMKLKNFLKKAKGFSILKDGSRREAEIVDNAH